MRRRHLLALVGVLIAKGSWAQTGVGRCFGPIAASAPGCSAVYGPGPVGYTGPGNFATAVGAYMLRAYSSATQSTTQCVNLRRSSDNATQDFGLINGNLDQGAIAAFGGVNATGTGAITGTTLTFTGGVIGGQVTGGTVAAGTLITAGTSPTWTVNISQTVVSATLTVANALFPTVLYNQLTPGTNDAVQATAGNQPYLALNAINGRASIWFTNNSAFRLVASGLTNPWATGGWAVDTFFLQALPTLTNSLFNATTTSEPALNSTATGVIQWIQVSSTSNGTWSTTFTLAAMTAYVLDVSYSQSSVANNPTITVNGSVKTTTNVNPVGTITAANGVSLGNTPAASRSVPAFHSEWIFFNTVPSAAIQEAIRQNSGKYYGIAVA